MKKQIIENYIRKIVKEELSKLNEMFIIFANNEPYEVVGSRKEAKANVEDYKTHADNKGVKFDIAPYDKMAKSLKMQKPKSYKELEKQKDLYLKHK